MEFQKLIACDQVTEDKASKVVINKREIGVTVFEGEYYAFDDLCTHADANLSDGCVVNGEVECPLHFARFCVKTGVVTEPPAFDDLKTYKTKVEDGFVWILI